MGLCDIVDDDFKALVRQQINVAGKDPYTPAGESQGNVRKKTNTNLRPTTVSATNVIYEALAAFSHGLILTDS
jgi:hypothetical protein